MGRRSAARYSARSTLSNERVSHLKPSIAAKQSKEPRGKKVDSAVKARRAEGLNRSEQSAWPELAGLVSAQSIESVSLQSFNQVHKNKQLQSPANAGRTWQSRRLLHRFAILNLLILSL